VSHSSSAVLFFVSLTQFRDEAGFTHNDIVKSTRYGLDGPGIESRWGTKFSAAVQTGPGAHPASYTMGTGSLFRG
jgi:hypothetical protein